MTEYKTIYNRFELKIEDISLMQMSEEVREEFLFNYMQSALSYIELAGLKIRTDLSDRDDSERKFNSTLYNSEIELISLYMVVAWYDYYINSLEHTLMFYGSKDEKWTSQKEHLRSMLDVQENYKIKARKYFRDYSYRYNDYLGNKPLEKKTTTSETEV